MGENPAEAVREKVGEVYRTDSRRVFASLVRLLGDFDLSEDALHNVFADVIGDVEIRQVGEISDLAPEKGSNDEGGPE